MIKIWFKELPYIQISQCTGTQANQPASANFWQVPYVIRYYQIELQWGRAMWTMWARSLLLLDNIFNCSFCESSIPETIPL